jgi:hypothetical protein
MDANVLPTSEDQSTGDIDHAAKITVLQGQVSNLRNDLVLARRVKDAERENAQLHRSFAEKQKQQVKDDEKSVVIFNEQMAAFKSKYVSDVEASRTELEELQAFKDQALKETTELKVKVKDLNSFKEAAKDLEHLREFKQKATKDLDHLRWYKAEATAQLDELNAKVKDLTKLNEEAKKEIQDHKALVQEQLQELEELRSFRSTIIRVSKLPVRAMPDPPAGRSSQSEPKPLTGAQEAGKSTSTPIEIDDEQLSSSLSDIHFDAGDEEMEVSPPSIPSSPGDERKRPAARTPLPSGRGEKKAKDSTGEARRTDTPSALQSSQPVIHGLDGTRRYTSQQLPAALTAEIETRWEGWQNAPDIKSRNGGLAVIMASTTNCVHTRAFKGSCKWHQLESIVACHDCTKFRRPCLVRRIDGSYDVLPLCTAARSNTPNEMTYWVRSKENTKGDDELANMPSWFKSGARKSARGRNV